MMDDKTGRIDPKLADVKRRLIVDLAERVHGMPVQHIEQKSMNVNIDGGTRDVSLPDTVEEVDAKIRELEARGRKMIESEQGVIEGVCESTED